MKCPECGINHKHSAGMRCSCGYQFALDPKREGMADARFLSIVAKASNGGETYFTKHGLYTAYCRRQTRWGLGLGRLFNAMFGPPSLNDLENLISRYEDTKGDLERMLRVPSLRTPPEDSRSPRSTGSQCSKAVARYCAAPLCSCVATSTRADRRSGPA